MKNLTALDVEHAWPERLRAVLESSPLVTDLVLDPVPTRHGGGYDGEVHFNVAGEPHRIIIECKSSGQPRYVRDAMAQLVRNLQGL